MHDNSTIHTTETVSAAQLLRRGYKVRCIDRTLSGWGKAAGGLSRYVICCETLSDAQQARDWLRSRSEMKFVSIKGKLPKCAPNDHLSITAFECTAAPKYLDYDGSAARRQAERAE